jgi:hypothetical protein
MVAASVILLSSLPAPKPAALRRCTKPYTSTWSSILTTNHQLDENCAYFDGSIKSRSWVQAHSFVSLASEATCHLPGRCLQAPAYRGY